MPRVPRPGIINNKLSGGAIITPTNRGKLTVILLSSLWTLIACRVRIVFRDHVAWRGVRGEGEGEEVSSRAT